jgi:hypothetical protein
MMVSDETSSLLFFSIFMGTLSGAIFSALVSLYFHYVNFRDAEEIKNNPVEYGETLKRQLKLVTWYVVFLIITLVCAMLFFLLPEYRFVFLSILIIIVLIIVSNLYCGIKQVRKTITLPKWDYFQGVMLFFLICSIVFLHLALRGIPIP